MFKLTIKTPKKSYSRHSGVSIVNFEHILQLSSVSTIQLE